MRTLSDTIGRLNASRNAMAEAMVDMIPGNVSVPKGADRLTDLVDFGTNPGALQARIHVPKGLPDHAPLVVVLHGCTQTAAGYDHGSGWSTLADERGFALLFPEQTRANNANLCFNWFVPGDTKRGGGEAQSIRDMVAAMVAKYRLDGRRVFITGLSAGGAMATTMLATYPDVFAAGAIIAGIPHGTAGTTAEAFDRMRGHGLPDETALARLVETASPPRTHWPLVSIWQGSADRTVDPANAEALLAQWRRLHGLGAEPTRRETADGYSRRVWCDAVGTPRVMAYDIAGMGHGTPIDATGAGALGTAAPYMLDIGVSSTRHIAAGWGLAPAMAAPAPASKAGTKPGPKPATVGSDAVSMVENALRAAGLMR